MEVVDLIATCQRIESLDFSPQVTTDADLIFEEMKLRYAMAPPAEGPVSAKNTRGQWHELVQHLTDLAYITPAQFAEWHAYGKRGEPVTVLLASKVAAAAVTFVKEDDYPEYRLLPPVGRPLDWVANYLGVILYRAGLHTSFDGDFFAQPDYVVGSLTAFGRSLAFRMRVLFQVYTGRNSARRKSHFDADLFPLLYSLNNSLDDNYSSLLPARDDITLHVTVQQLLLDGHSLFDAFRDANRFGRESERPYFLAYDLDDVSNVPVDRRTARLRKRATRRLSGEELHVDTGSNQLGVRLLQMSLWRAGFYTGVLDGAFGLLTHNALLELIEQETEQENEGPRTQVLKPRQLQKLLVRSDDEDGGVWLVDLRLAGKLIDAYSPPSSEEAREEEDRIWSRIRQEGLEERLDREFSDRQTELRPVYGDLERHPDRRVYYGLRGLLRGAFRAIGRIVSWVAGVITAVVGAVFDFVKAVAKRCRQGVGMFLTGFKYFLHYALGKPLITLGLLAAKRHPVMTTSFRIDLDVTSWIGESATPDDLRKHADNIREMGEGLAYFVDSLTTLISLIAHLSAPPGWLRLGVLLSRRIYDRLSGENALNEPLA